jgi:putative transcriptional regulator
MNNVNKSPPLSGLLREIHHRIEAKERSRISQSAMAERLGISSRTYLEYLRGTNSPIGMKAVLDLLCMLDDQELNQIIQHWRTNTISGTNYLKEKND